MVGHCSVAEVTNKIYGEWFNHFCKSKMFPHNMVDETIIKPIYHIFAYIVHNVQQKFIVINLKPINPELLLAPEYE